MDQSFSAENFRRIWDLRTRRGEDLLPLFPRIHKLTLEIRDLRVSSGAVTAKSALPHPDPTTNDELEHLRQRRRSELQHQLRKLSTDLSLSIESGNFRFGLSEGPTVRGRPTYQVKVNEAPVYFASRQVEWNIGRAFDVRPPNRNLIVEQLVRTLQDSTPKLVARTDIEQFYESIDHDALIQYVTEPGRLSATTRLLIRQLLTEYRDLTGRTKGLPRGLALSATLAEAYLRQLDRDLREMSGVLLYGRYVDDIVIVFNNDPLSPEAKARRKEIRAAVRKLDLRMNSSKTSYKELPSNATSPVRITFLGYKVTVSAESLNIDISADRSRRYKERLDIAIDTYLAERTNPRAIGALHQRLKFLTGNTRLANNKRQALVGSHFSNPLITDLTSEFKKLEDHLARRIDTLPLPKAERDSLSRYNFTEGISRPVYYKFSARQLAQIVKVWSNV